MVLFCSDVAGFIRAPFKAYFFLVIFRFVPMVSADDIHFQFNLNILTWHRTLHKSLLLNLSFVTFARNIYRNSQIIFGFSR